MTIDTISKNKIKISLTDKEILEIFGGYEMIDYKYPNAKKALNMLLRQALPDEMLPIDCKRVLIEVKPEAFGCAIYFTKIYDSAAKRFKKIDTTKSYTLSFDGSSALIDCILIMDTNPIISSSLYILEGKYNLLITTIMPLAAYIGEFCKITEDKCIFSHICEYGKPICECNAIEKIKSAFSKKT